MGYIFYNKLVQTQIKDFERKKNNIGKTKHKVKTLIF